MRLPDFQLHKPANLAQASSLLQNLEEGEFDWLGGGTDLLCNYKWRIQNRDHVISTRGIAELLDSQPGSLAAGRTLWEIEQDPVLAERYPALVAAVSRIATPVIRRSATLGGNLLLDTRCWHLNQTVEWRRAHGSCLKAEAEICRVMPDPGDVCVATYSGDLAPVLLVYGAEVELARPEADGSWQSRKISLAEFYQEDGIRRFRDKGAREILLRVHLPQEASAWTVNYQKLRLREAFDFPEGGVAAGVRWQAGRAAEIRLATTAYASIPELHPELCQGFAGGTLEESDRQALGEALMAKVRPMKNTAMSPAYRKKMAAVLCRRALLACVEAAPQP